MPISVYNKQGKYLGIIIRRFPEEFHTFMIALTDLLPNNFNVDMNIIIKYLAKIYKCKNLLGKIDEEELKSIVLEKLHNEENTMLRQINYEDYLKLLFLKKFESQDIKSFLEIELDDSKINGYLLFNFNNIKVLNGKIIIDDEIDYISEEKIDEEAPIYAKIVDYPIVQTQIMGAGGLLLGADLADFGGKNHSHTTSIEMKSGNYISNIYIPVLLNVRKDMMIQFYIANNKINQVFCDGVIYRFDKY